MQLPMTVIDPAAEPPISRDVIVEADVGATLFDVAADLRRAVGCADREPGFRVAGRTLDPTHPLGADPLLRGAVLTLDRGDTPRMPPAADAVVQLAVVGGPGAGRVIPLSRGVTVIGRGGGCGVRLADSAVSRHHLEICVASSGVTVRELSPTNPARLNGIPLDDHPTALRPGDRLQLGATTIVHRVSPVSPAASTLGEGVRRVHRPPRFVRSRPVTRVEFPTRPKRAERSRLPLIAALVPMVLSMLLSLVLRSPVMMLFALLTPAMLLAQGWSDRRRGRLSGHRQEAEYARSRAAAEELLAAALERERLDRLDEAPDLATVARVMTAVDARLWERRPCDPDYLSLRVGLGPQRARTTAVGDEADVPTLPFLEVPVVIRLAEAGVVGVAGPRDRGLALTSGLVGQLCAWHSPRDVRIVLLTAEDDAPERWSWAWLLPHLRALDGTCLAALADLSCAETVARRLAELTALLDARTEAATSTRSGPDVVVILDGSERLRQQPGVAELLRDGPAAGIRFVCLDREATRLPIEATAQVVVDHGPATTTRLDSDEEAVPSFVPDLPDPTWAERLGRVAAPLEDATPLEDGPVLPTEVDFLELHRRHPEVGDPFDPLDPAFVAARWSTGGGRPMALLGAGTEGAVVVDLVRDGPHALVGGTTGAGKSELLQALVASLAVHSPPDELSFVLIDYKGGSAFRECAALPHVLGVVTDLDEHLTTRALTSLTAELRRREHILASAGAKDLDDYRRPAGRGEPLARLVLVVDEFRVLAEELPDFVGGLVRLAAVGRSLGVHLVLATQRPAGIISADMRANVSLRIALRVRDRSDSDDIIEAPDAARISDRLPGRAFVRGGAQRLVAVQVAHLGSGAGRPPATLPPRVVTRPIDWAGIMAPLPRPSAPAAAATGPTTMQALASALTEAARVLHSRTPVSPWLPPLPDMLYADDHRLGSTDDGSAQPARAVSIGLVDRPAEQRQTAFTWHPTRDGHLGIAGGARTGRTTAVINVALRLAERFAPTELHLHALVGAPGALAGLETLPHVGSISGTDDPQRLRRAILRLAGPAQLSDRTTVVLVDGWEAISESLDDLDQGESTERLLGLIRDGLSRGVHVVVTGGRAVASGRLGSLLQRRLVLDMPDPVDLILAGISAAGAASHRPPGRALDVRDEAEVQLCLPAGCADQDGPGADGLAAKGTTADIRAARDRSVVRAVAAVADRWGPVPAESRPWRLSPLPTEVALGQLRPQPDQVLVGLGGDDLSTVGFDLSRDERRVLVLGPRHSGKSTTLRTLLVQLVSQGREVALVATRRSPLSQLPPGAGLHVLSPNESDRFIALRRAHTDLAVLVDDADTIDGTPLESALTEAARHVETTDGFMAVSLDSRRAAGMFRGLVPEVGRAGAGVVLMPSSTADGDLLRVRLEPQSLRLPGRGVLVTDGLPIPVQVATAALPNAPFVAELVGTPVRSPSNTAFEGHDAVKAD